MKKVIKKAVAKVPVKKTVAKKPMMKTGGSKKSLPKAQKAGQTPFQEYLTIPGTSAKDTIPSYNTVEKTKTYPTLKKAYELTYGQDYDRKAEDYYNNLGKLESYRGDHSGYSNMNSPQRQAFSKEVATKRAAVKKQKVGGATKAAYKKGGVVKKTTAKKVMVKSKKK